MYKKIKELIGAKKYDDVTNIINPLIVESWAKWHSGDREEIYKDINKFSTLDYIIRNWLNTQDDKVRMVYALGRLCGTKSAFSQAIYTEKQEEKAKLLYEEMKDYLYVNEIILILANEGPQTWEVLKNKIRLDDRKFHSVMLTIESKTNLINITEFSNMCSLTDAGRNYAKFLKIKENKYNKEGESV